MSKLTESWRVELGVAWDSSPNVLIRRADLRTLLDLIEAAEEVANHRDVLYPSKFRFGAAENHVAGYRAAQGDLRAAMAEVDR